VIFDVLINYEDHDSKLSILNLPTNRCMRFSRRAECTDSGLITIFLSESSIEVSKEKLL